MRVLRTCALVCLLAAPAVHAANIIVTTTADELVTDGDCSLREAVISANTDLPIDDCTAGSGADMIVVPAGTYTMSVTGAGENAAATGDLDLTGTVHVAGAGPMTTILEGYASDRFFEVRSGADVLLSGMALRNASPAQAGAAVMNRATLAIQNCSFEGNLADDSTGGAIYGLAGTTLEVENATFDGNVAETDGGAITNHGAATLTAVTFMDNDAVGRGGAIYQSPNGSLAITTALFFQNGAGEDGGALFTDAPTTIDDSTFILNTVGDASIGGAAISCADTVTVRGSAIAFNVSDAWAGGISTSASCTLTLTNVTVHGNQAANEGGGIRTAGGGTITLENATVTGNASDTDLTGFEGGGGIDCATGGTVTVRNSVIAGNTSAGAANDCEGTLTSEGHNLLQTTTGCTMALATGDQTGVDPQLGSYADNGGPSFTRLPASTSPLVDAGDPGTPGSGGTTCAAVDQRGWTRPAGAACDIGAVERGATASTTTTSTTVVTTSTSSSTTSTSTTVTTTTSSSSSTAPPASSTTTTTASSSTSTTLAPPPPSPTTTTTLPLPLCRNGAPMQSMALRLAKLGGGAGDERLVISGALMLPPGPTLDPGSIGMQLLLVDTGTDNALLDLTAATWPIPPGGKGTGCGPKDGWKGTTYDNRSGAVGVNGCPAGSAQGIRRVRLKDRRARGRGVSFTIQAQGAFPAPVGPLQLTLVAGAAPDAGVHGTCGSHTFAAAACTARGATYRCR